MPIAGSTSTWVRMRVVPLTMQSSRVCAARLRVSSTVKSFLISATRFIGLIRRPASAGRRSISRDLSRWMWVSISPAQASGHRHHSFSPAGPSPCPRAAIRAALDADVHGSASGRLTSLALRTIRSIAGPLLSDRVFGAQA